MENIQDKVGDDKEDLGRTKDPNPETWINEDLWKKLGFKMISYIAWISATAISIQPSISWDWKAFLIGVQMIILPIFWAASDAQSRNREIQQLLETEEKFSIEKNEFERKLNKMEDENERLKEKLQEKRMECHEVKCELDSVTKTLEANREALNTVK